VPSIGSDADQFYTTVDDETYEELSALAGQRIVHLAVWEDSLADALADLPEAGLGPAGVDLDLYLQDGVYFELYSTYCYTDLNAEPLADQRAVERQLAPLLAAGLWLGEIAVDEEDGLVLVLTRQHQPVLYCQVGAWLLDGWEELPEEAAS
jgi:hypothetical protein